LNILLRDVLKKYNNKIVLDIKEFMFQSGKIYGIIGPNGAGKSTMLKIIAQLEDKNRGNIFIDNKNVDKEIMMKMTYLTQKPYLFNTSVFNNIAYPLKFRKYNKVDIKKKVNDIMEAFKITHLSEQSALSLSGGEGQKVALARALVFEPELLLLDEPTSAIDPNSTEHIEKIIIKSNRENNTTILFVTHNVAQAKRVCDDVIFIDEGSIVEYGDKEMVILSPKTEKARRYLSFEYYVN